MCSAVVRISPVFALAILAFPSALPAATDRNDPSLFSMTLQMLAALVLVLGLFLLLYALVRKSRGWLPAKAGGQFIDVRAVRHLGPKKSLYLVDVDGRRFFLAAAGEQISLLSNWSTPGSGAESTPESCSKTDSGLDPDAPPDFAALLQQQVVDAGGGTVDPVVKGE